jgi:hypothetical protein
VSAVAQNSPCKFLCEPVFLIEPTITFEKDATVFETIFALDLSTPIPRVGVTLEAITKPFSDDNDVELESELKLYWLESERTRGNRRFTGLCRDRLACRDASLVIFCGVCYFFRQGTIEAI